MAESVAVIGAGTMGVRSPEDGTLRDIVIVAHMVDDTWSTMLTGGFEEAIG